jgi:hypothetical protein
LHPTQFRNLTRWLIKRELRVSRWVLCIVKHSQRADFKICGAFCRKERKICRSHRTADRLA